MRILTRIDKEIEFVSNLENARINSGLSGYEYFSLNEKKIRKQAEEAELL